MFRNNSSNTEIIVKYTARFIFILGLMLVFLVPPFQKPDEIFHYYRTAQVSNGVLGCKNDDSSLIEGKYFQLVESIRQYDLPFKPENKIHVKQLWHMFSNKSTDDASDKHAISNNICSLPFIPYIPGASVLFISKIINLSPLFSFYLVRLSIFLLSYFIFIKILKQTKINLRLVTVFFFSIPMVVHQLTAISYDWLFIISSAWIFLLITNAISDKTIKLSELIQLVFAYFLLFITKGFGYEAFLLLLFLVPFKTLTYKSRVIGIILIVTALLLSVALRLLQLDGINSSKMDFVSPAAQSTYLLNNMSELPFLIFTTIDDRGTFYIESLIGIFGWLDYKLSSFVLFVYVATFGILVIVVSKTYRCNHSLSLLIYLLITTATFFLVHLVLYLFWTPVGYEFVGGVQGRYFLPLVPYIVLLLAEIIHRRILFKIFLITGLILICVSILVSIFERYYYTWATFDQSISTPSNITKIDDHYHIKSIDGRKIAGFDILINTDENFADSRIGSVVTYSIFKDCNKSKSLFHIKSISSERVNNKVHSEIFRIPINSSENICLKINTLFNLEIEPIYLR